MELKEVLEKLNAIYHKSQQAALTAAELEERDRLRRIYLDAMKQQVRNSLDSIKIIEGETTETTKPRHNCHCGHHHH